MSNLANLDLLVSIILIPISTIPPTDINRAAIGPTSTELTFISVTNVEKEGWPTRWRQEGDLISNRLFYSSVILQAHKQV